MAGVNRGAVGWWMAAVGSAALLLAGPASAQRTTTTQSFGGNGGGPYKLQCPSGMAMVGIKGRFGAWVDAVAPVCAVWVAGSRTLGEIDDQPGTGGGGGGSAVMRCSGRRGVATGVAVWQADNEDRSVGRIVLECGDYLQPGVRRPLNPAAVMAFGESMGSGRVNLRCGPGEVAVGLLGRSGRFVDRIGLLCQRSLALGS
jgi:hypothetical protein